MTENVLTGGCHCGKIRYQVAGPTHIHALCHCTDCRRHAGAPMVAWAMYPADALKITQGEPKLYESSADGRRFFCADCGSGLFYANNAMLPGSIDVQSATFDNPDAVPPEMHIQIAERISWMEKAHELPMVERFPPH